MFGENTKHAKMTTIYVCPTDARHHCSWEGPADDIYEHFTEEHEDLLIEDINLEIDLQTPSENLLLFYNSEIYLVQYKISNNILNIKLRFLGSQQNASKITYILTAYLKDENLALLVKDKAWEINLNHANFKEDDKQVITCKFAIDAQELNLECKTIPSDEDEVVEVDETLVDAVVSESGQKRLKKYTKLVKTKSYTEGSKRRLNRTIKPTRHKSVVIAPQNKEVSETLAPLPLILTIPEELTEEHLPCTNCSKVMLPPITLCLCGHSICNTCEFKYERCVKCDKASTNSRNKKLEEISRNYLHECKYAKNGCPSKVKYDEIVRHEMLCNFCTYICPISNCETQDTFQELHSHFRIFHPSVKITQNLTADFPKNSEFFIVNLTKGVFYCSSVASENDVEWRVVFCGPEEHVFYCELLFKNNKYFLKRQGRSYSLKKGFVEMKKLKIKEKHAVLRIEDSIC